MPKKNRQPVKRTKKTASPSLPTRTSSPATHPQTNEQYLTDLTTRINTLSAQGDHFFSRQCYQEAIQPYHDLLNLLMTASVKPQVKIAIALGQLHNLQKNLICTSHLLGKSHLFTGNVRSAKVFFKLAWDKDPTCYEAGIDYAYTCCRHDNYSPAAEIYQRLSTCQDASPETQAMALFNLCKLSLDGHLEETLTLSDAEIETNLQKAGENYPSAYCELGKLRYEKGEIDEAIAAFQAAIKHNILSAHYDLGTLYMNTHRDMPAAIKHLTIAADANHPKALFNLAILYDEGIDTPKDLEKELECLQRAEKTGSLLPLHNLGYKYLYGDGVPRNPELAVDYFLRNIQADPDSTDPLRIDSTAKSAEELGNCYYHGVGTIQDLQAAGICWQKAAIHRPGAKCSLAGLYFYGNMQDEPDAENLNK